MAGAPCAIPQAKEDPRLLTWQQLVAGNTRAPGTWQPSTADERAAPGAGDDDGPAVVNFVE